MNLNRCPLYGSATVYCGQCAANSPFEEIEQIEDFLICDPSDTCLVKSIDERTEEDIEDLLEFVEHIPVFADLSFGVLRELCAVMSLEVFDDAGTIILNDGDELESWRLLLSGVVEIECPDGNKYELFPGDSFGVTPTLEKMHHVGIVRTKSKYCEFIVVPQFELYFILH